MVRERRARTASVEVGRSWLQHLFCKGYSPPYFGGMGLRAPQPANLRFQRREDEHGNLIEGRMACGGMIDRCTDLRHTETRT